MVCKKENATFTLNYSLQVLWILYGYVALRALGKKYKYIFGIIRNIMSDPESGLGIPSVPPLVLSITLSDVCMESLLLISNDV